MKQNYSYIVYDVSNSNIHVYNSYVVFSEKTKKDFLRHLLDTVDGLSETRTLKSMLDEWKAHNALYQRNMFKAHTKELDLEFKQKWYHRVIYWLIARLIKEIL